ncbi:hypothetical protein CRYUN_Cryun14cG0151200 [Craigia yunnanensis]
MKMEAQQEENIGGMKRNRKVTIEGMKPYAICIFCNICFAGYNIISKVSLDNGMSSYVLVVYGHVMGTLTTALLAVLFERKNDTKISMVILRVIFFLGILGAVLGRTLFYAGLKATSPAVAAALSNLIPSMTFILAVLCRMEPLNISKHSPQAKVGGTVVALAGATLMTLYKGRPPVKGGQGSPVRHFKSPAQLSIDGQSRERASLVIPRTVTVKKYPAPITLTSLTCLSGTILSAIMTAVLDHKASSWRFSWDMSLVAVLYSGIVVFGLTFYLHALVGRTKGAVFFTAFRPLGTVIATIMALLILGDVLFLGSVVGAIVIVVGLYLTLWGKRKGEGKETIGGYNTYSKHRNQIRKVIKHMWILIVAFKLKSKCFITL